MPKAPQPKSRAAIRSPVSGSVRDLKTAAKKPRAATKDKAMQAPSSNAISNKGFAAKGAPKKTPKTLTSFSSSAADGGHAASAHKKGDKGEPRRRPKEKRREAVERVAKEPGAVLEKEVFEEALDDLAEREPKPALTIGSKKDAPEAQSKMSQSAAAKAGSSTNKRSREKT